MRHSLLFTIENKNIIKALGHLFFLNLTFPNWEINLTILRQTSLARCFHLNLQVYL